MYISEHKFDHGNENIYYACGLSEEYVAWLNRAVNRIVISEYVCSEFPELTDEEIFGDAEGAHEIRLVFLNYVVDVIEERSSYIKGLKEKEGQLTLEQVKRIAKETLPFKGALPVSRVVELTAEASEAHGFDVVETLCFFNAMLEFRESASDMIGKIIKASFAGDSEELRFNIMDIYNEVSDDL